jgi:hypothetical protein
MELLDSYLKAVKRYLPRAQRNDIVAELSVELRSQMESREDELGRRLSDREQMAILKEYGGDRRGRDGHDGAHRIAGLGDGGRRNLCAFVR